MDELKKELVKPFIEDAVSPVAKEIGAKAADLINVIGTPIEVLRKYKDIRINNFFEKLERKMRSVPEKELTEFNPRIISNAVEEVMKYAYDEEFLQEMFSNIIVASMKKKEGSLIHPSFIEIVKQFGPVEYYILQNRLIGKIYCENNTISYCDNPDELYAIVMISYPQLYAPKDLTKGGATEGPFYFTTLPYGLGEVANAIVTLKRLGIVDVLEEKVKDFLGDETKYKKLYEKSIYQNIFQKHEQQIEILKFNSEIFKCRIVITNLGLSLAQVCCDLKEVPEVEIDASWG